MPAATTHVEFAKDVYKNLDPEIQAQITNPNMFFLGSQGPDVLLFSRLSLLPGSLNKYGSLMHIKKTKEVMAYFDRYGVKDGDLRSYFYGFLCHYALDSIAHPLVDAIAKYRHEQEGIHQGECHVTMEADIDTWLMEQQNRGLDSYDVYKYLKVDKASAEKLAKLYRGLFKSVYHIDIPVYKFREAILGMSSYTKLLTPNERLTNTVHRIEGLVHQPHALSGMMLNGKNDRRIINEEHISYPLEYDPSQSIDASFPELYDKALKEAAQLLQHHSEEDFDVNFAGEPLK